jgi:hypothetical protein
LIGPQFEVEGYEQWIESPYGFSDGRTDRSNDAVYDPFLSHIVVNSQPSQASSG